MRWLLPLVCSTILNWPHNLHAAPDAACETPAAIRFSIVPAGDSEKRLKAFRPLLRRIETLSGHPVKVVRPQSYAAVVEGILAGGIDVAELGPAAYVAARNGDSRITPFATLAMRPGIFQVTGPFYHSLLAVLADGPHVDAAALKGARLALADPGSTSGSLVPRALFAPLLGAPFEHLFGAVSYSGNHRKSVVALAAGEVDAIFIASNQLDEAAAAGILPIDRVRILWKSEPIPRDPFVQRGQLCEPLRQAIRAAFFGPGAETALRSVFDDLQAERFVGIDDSHYAVLRQAISGKRP